MTATHALALDWPNPKLNPDPNPNPNLNPNLNPNPNLNLNLNPNPNPTLTLTLTLTLTHAEKALVARVYLRFNCVRAVHKLSFKTITKSFSFFIKTIQNLFNFK